MLAFPDVAIINMKIVHLFSLALCIFFTACAPQSTPIPVSPQDMVATVVAATVAAMPSPTQPLPTATAASTRVPPTDFPTPTPPATIPPLPTLTSPPSLTPSATVAPVGGAEVGNTQGEGNYSCQVVKQIPDDWKKVKPGEIVNVVWQIKNTGKKPWTVSEFQFRYVDGEKMYANTPSLALITAVNPGETGDFLLSVKAPKPGYYSMTWGITKGSGVFCTVKIQLTVK